VTVCVATPEELVLHRNGSPASAGRQSWGAAGEPAATTRASQMVGPASLTSVRGDRTGRAGFPSVFGCS